MEVFGEKNMNVKKGKVGGNGERERGGQGRTEGREKVKGRINERKILQ